MMIAPRTLGCEILRDHAAPDPVAAAELGGELVETLGPPGDEREVQPLGREAVRERHTDARGRPRDERPVPVAFESWHGGRLAGCRGEVQRLRMASRAAKGRDARLTLLCTRLPHSEEARRDAIRRAISYGRS